MFYLPYNQPWLKHNYWLMRMLVQSRKTSFSLLIFASKTSHVIMPMSSNPLNWNHFNCLHTFAIFIEIPRTTKFTAMSIAIHFQSFFYPQGNKKIVLDHYLLMKMAQNTSCKYWINSKNVSKLSTSYFNLEYKRQWLQVGWHSLSFGDYERCINSHLPRCASLQLSTSRYLKVKVLDLDKLVQWSTQ